MISHPMIQFGEIAEVIIGCSDCSDSHWHLLVDYGRSGPAQAR